MIKSYSIQRVGHLAGLGFKFQFFHSTALRPNKSCLVGLLIESQGTMYMEVLGKSDATSRACKIYLLPGGLGPGPRLGWIGVRAGKNLELCVSTHLQVRRQT